MSKSTGILLFFLAVVGQVLSDDVEVGFVENFAKRELNGGSRIVSGWEAEPGQHPHQILLRVVNWQGGVGSCGGSVVSREWAISAAHCTAAQVAVVIRAGVTTMTRPQYISETTEWYNYPTFDENRPLVVQPNDISIMKLSPRVTYNEYLKPIRIQSSADAFRNYDGEQVYASGFGRTWTGGFIPETLNWVYLRAVSNQNCASTFGTTLVTSNTICARFWNVTSQSICQGDSGGPLVHVGVNGPTLIGVSSFVAGGEFGCHSGLPGAFMRPGPFLGWFKQVTGVDFENLDETEEETTLPPPTTIDTTTEDSPPPTTKLPDPTTPESEEEEEETDEDSSSEEDKETADLLKRLQVKIKVKVKLDKFKKKHVIDKVHEIRG
ncbi:collagenase-like [Hyposmocoma kahamanoa]|uniref:collagenase-like n=1 Tax=Hyposmocoma kahamanoa TaxID=1477025 RepID=UPI000E6D9A30|nr:collagenase-like [Hyposmocoma kahamanoa]